VKKPLFPNVSSFEELFTPLGRYPKGHDKVFCEWTIESIVRGTEKIRVSRYCHIPGGSVVVEPKPILIEKLKETLFNPGLLYFRVINCTDVYVDYCNMVASRLLARVSSETIPIITRKGVAHE
jgi:hypothetical protein